MNIAFIGTSQSYFTRKFLPALPLIPNSHVAFVCVSQKEFSIIPSKVSGFLKFLFLLKKFKNYLNKLSSTFYWSIYCQQHKITFSKTGNVNSDEVVEILNACDYVLTAGIRSRFDFKILTAPKNGIINFHYSLLPKYRGTNPVFWQKAYCDPDFGYTFHLMNEHMDRGNIILQKQVPVSRDQSVSDICNQLTDHASNQIFGIFKSLSTIPQNEFQASEFTNQDYLNYINISTSDPGSEWFEKCKVTKLFILNERWIVHLNHAPIEKQSARLSMNGSFSKDGYFFKFRKINYLPPVFYYFALKTYFE